MPIVFFYFSSIFPKSVYPLSRITSLNLLCCLSDLKCMVSAGLASLASSSYDLAGAVAGKRALNVLCVGHGGGNLPLFFASKIKGKE